MVDVRTLYHQAVELVLDPEGDVRVGVGRAEHLDEPAVLLGVDGVGDGRDFLELGEQRVYGRLEILVPFRAGLAQVEQRAGQVLVVEHDEGVVRVLHLELQGRRAEAVVGVQRVAYVERRRQDGLDGPVDVDVLDRGEHVDGEFRAVEAYRAERPRVVALLVLPLVALEVVGPGAALPRADLYGLVGYPAALAVVAQPGEREAVAHEAVFPEGWVVERDGEAEVVVGELGVQRHAIQRAHHRLALAAARLHELEAEVDGLQQVRLAVVVRRDDGAYPAELDGGLRDVAEARYRYAQQFHSCAPFRCKKLLHIIVLTAIFSKEYISQCIKSYN